MELLSDIITKRIEIMHGYKENALGKDQVFYEYWIDQLKGLLPKVRELEKNRPQSQQNSIEGTIKFQDMECQFKINTGE